MDFKAIARNTHKLKQLGLSQSQIIEAQVTDKSSLTQSGEGIDTVISAVGITC
jgi:putative NADH-flavin reductase